MTTKTKKILFGTALVIGLIWTINYFFNSHLKNSDLKEITGTLSTPPLFSSTSKDNYVELILNNGTSRYHTSGIGYKEMDREAVKKDLKTGDRITLLVSKERGINEVLDGLVDVIDFYDLKSNGITYLELEKYNEQRKGNRVFFFVLWSFFFGLYIYSFWFTNESHHK
tara:strand:- start:5617 stop:6120 length:504 start_codon:yes stop_codon:yes gene_type:complete